MMYRYLVIDRQAANGIDQAFLANIPVVQNPGLSRQARMAQEEDSYQSAPYTGPQFADARDDSASAQSGPPAYGAPGPAPHAGPDHVDYGAYTGGYGAFGWYTDHPVLLGPGHRRKRQHPKAWPRHSRDKRQVPLQMILSPSPDLPQLLEEGYRRRI